MIPESIAVTLIVAEQLERLGVRYAVGGSLASSMHGVPRASVDADIVAELGADHVPALTAALRDTFYVPTGSFILEAIARRSSFNVVHLDTMFKVDIFIAKESVFDRAQLERRSSILVTREPERTLQMATAEDTVLAKLDWYRRGGEASERQWRDVLGVLQVQRGRLDLDYLGRISSQLAVKDLLERALAEAAKS